MSREARRSPMPAGGSCTTRPTRFTEPSSWLREISRKPRSHCFEEISHARNFFLDGASSADDAACDSRQPRINPAYRAIRAALRMGRTIKEKGRCRHRPFTNYRVELTGQSCPDL